LLQKTQKEANWDMENDSDFQEGSTNLCKTQTHSLLDYSQETSQNMAERELAMQERKKGDSFSVPFNEEFEIKREKLVSLSLILILS